MGEDTQPEVNIGLVGHVDHGKTTLTEQLSGKWTDTHSEELKRGITIRLGYADTIIRQCKKCKSLTVRVKCKECEGETKILRKVSFVDAPGHESLMATMLGGATIMDGALLLIAANEECPQPQTREHLMALKISGIKNVVIVQNKIDLVSKELAMKNYNQIKEFLKGTDYDDAPIIPISAQYGINIDALLETIQEKIPTPKRDDKAEPIMFVARSFDMNKPGCKAKDLKGGVLGGALQQGKLKKGMQIEIKPGHVYTEANQQVYKSIVTEVIGLVTGGKPVDEVRPGGSIGVMTLLGPNIIKSDSLAGSIVGAVGNNIPVWHELVLDVKLLDRVVGLKTVTDVDPIKMGEVLMLNVNSAATVGVVTKFAKGNVHCKLKLPVCANKGSRVTISRRIGTRFRLIGYGLIQEL